MSEKKIAVVTGGARGIGKAIALELAKAGNLVVINYNGSEEKARETKAEIEAAGGQADILQCNVADFDACEAFFKAVAEKYGRVDILVNNAGVFDELLPAGEVSDEIWDRVISTNLTAPMRGIRAVIPVFEKQGGGVIVNTASIAGFTGARGGGAAYVASKHGLIGLTKNVAFNYKDKNIRCNAVAPGRVETNLRVNSENLIGSKTAHDKSIDNWRDIETKVSEGYITNMRKCTPDEIAKVVLFLASDEASFVNGSIFVADGGWTSY